MGERAVLLIQEDRSGRSSASAPLVDLAAEHPRLFEFNQVSLAIAALDRRRSTAAAALTHGEAERLAAQRDQPEPLHLLVWSCLQGYAGSSPPGATDADDAAFIRAAPARHQI